MARKRCPNPACKVSIHDEFHTCGACWRLLPPSMRRKINAAPHDHNREVQMDKARRVWACEPAPLTRAQRFDTAASDGGHRWLT